MNWPWCFLPAVGACASQQHWSLPAAGDAGQGTVSDLSTHVSDL